MGIYGLFSAIFPSNRFHIGQSMCPENRGKIKQGIGVRAYATIHSPFPPQFMLPCSHSAPYHRPEEPPQSENRWLFRTKNIYLSEKIRKNPNFVRKTVKFIKICYMCEKNVTSTTKCTHKRARFRYRRIPSDGHSRRAVSTCPTRPPSS